MRRSKQWPLDMPGRLAVRSCSHSTWEQTVPTTAGWSGTLCSSELDGVAPVPLWICQSSCKGRTGETLPLSLHVVRSQSEIRSSCFVQTLLSPHSDIYCWTHAGLSWSLDVLPNAQSPTQSPPRWCWLWGLPASPTQIYNGSSCSLYDHFVKRRVNIILSHNVDNYSNWTIAIEWNWLNEYININ